jgi:hypothetical protein
MSAAAASPRPRVTCAASTRQEQPSRPAPVPTPRRALLAAVLLAAARPAAAASLPPPIGDCTDCLGEVNSTLNACPLSKTSCVSTLNDDEAHFAAPWEFNVQTAAAVDRLLEVATGGAFEPGLVSDPFGIPRADAAGFIARSVAAAVTNNPPPQRPERRRAEASEPFKGTVVDRHTTSAGGEYVRIEFAVGGSEGGKEGEGGEEDILDAEFLFLNSE